VSHMLTQMMTFKESVERQSLPQDMAGGSPMCMSQYPRILGTTRIPALPVDVMQVTGAAARTVTFLQQTNQEVLWRGEENSVCRWGEVD
jgi:hypothetical protein